MHPVRPNPSYAGIMAFCATATVPGTSVVESTEAGGTVTISHADVRHASQQSISNPR